LKLYVKSQVTVINALMFGPTSHYWLVSINLMLLWADNWISPVTGSARVLVLFTGRQLHRATGHWAPIISTLINGEHINWEDHSSGDLSIGRLITRHQIV